MSFSFPIVQICVSTDGKTVNTYPFSEGGSFDGTTLTINDVLSVTLTRGYQGGQLVTLAGTIQGKTVSGSTYFNPVALPVFVGSYIEVKPTAGTNILNVASSSLMFDFGSGLQNVALFAYDPAMYVLEFLSPTLQSYTLMLGTGSTTGLACFITGGSGGDAFAVTIPAPTST